MKNQLMFTVGVVVFVVYIFFYFKIVLKNQKKDKRN